MGQLTEIVIREDKLDLLAIIFPPFLGFPLKGSLAASTKALWVEGGSSPVAQKDKSLDNFLFLVRNSPRRLLPTQVAAHGTY